MEEFEYFVDKKKVAYNDFEIMLEEAIEVIAREDGIYYDWLNQHVPNNDYEEFVGDLFSKFMKELNDLNICYAGYNTFEKRRI